MTTEAVYARWCAKQVGHQEHPRGSNMQEYAPLAHHKNGEPWCATGLVAGAKVTGLRLPPGADVAYTPAMESAFKRAGRLSKTPRVGAFGFLFFPNMKPEPRVAHVFFIWKIVGSTLFTIEFNSNPSGGREGYIVCFRKRSSHRAIGQIGPRSYGMPYYTTAPAKAPAKPGKPAMKPPAKPSPAAAKDDDMRLDPKDIELIADALMHRLQTQPVVPNPAIRKGEPDAAPMTIVACLENMETNQDQDRARYLLPIRDAVLRGRK